MIKRKVFIILILVIAGKSSVNAQIDSIIDPIVTPSKKEYKNSITYYPISSLFNAFKIGYERKIYKNFSAKIITSILLTDTSGYYKASDIFEYYIEVQPRFYLGTGDKALHGFFGAPFYFYKNFSGSRKENQKPFNTSVEINDARANAIGVMIGYQYVSKSQFMFSISAGHGLMFPAGGYRAIGNRKSLYNSYSKGSTIKLDINLGIAF